MENKLRSQCRYISALVQICGAMNFSRSWILSWTFCIGDTAFTKFGGKVTNKVSDYIGKKYIFL